MNIGHLGILRDKTSKNVHDVQEVGETLKLTSQMRSKAVVSSK